MGLERRHDMLKYNKWRDHVFCIGAALLIAFAAAEVLHLALSAPKLASTSNMAVLATVALAPWAAFAVAMCISEMFLYWPGLVILYGQFGYLVVDMSILGLCLHAWNNEFAIAAALCALIISLAFYLSRDPLVYYRVLMQVQASTQFVRHRLGPALLAAIISSSMTLCLAYAICQSESFLSYPYSQYNLIFLLLALSILQSLVQFVLRGVMTGHYIHQFFLAGTQYVRATPIRSTLFRLLTGSLGTIFLAAMYYGGRNAIILYALHHRYFSAEPRSLEAGILTVVTSMIVYHLASTQRYRSLFQVVAYAYSFSESLMLTEVYPTFKIDLLNKMTCAISLTLSALVGSLSYCMIGPLLPSSSLAAKLAFVVTCQSYTMSQLVFEPARTASFTLAVGLCEDPRYLITRIPWLHDYYPPFL